MTKQPQVAGDALAAFEALNAKFGSEVPKLPADTKFVICDGCERLITYAVFRKPRGRGFLDICNVCRAEAEGMPKHRLYCTGMKTTVSIDPATLAYVGLAPVPSRYLKDLGLTHAPDPREVEPAVGVAAARARLQCAVRVSDGKCSPVGHASAATASAGDAQTKKKRRSPTPDTKVDDPQPNKRRRTEKATEDAATEVSGNLEARRGRPPASKSKKSKEQEATAVDESKPVDAPQTANAPQSSAGGRGPTSSTKNPEKAARRTAPSDATAAPETSAPADVDDESSIAAKVLKGKKQRGSAEVGPKPTTGVGKKLSNKNVAEGTGAPAPRATLPSRSTSAAPVLDHSSISGGTRRSTLVVDEDDKPFFLSQRNNEALAEAVAHPVTIPESVSLRGSRAAVSPIVESSSTGTSPTSDAPASMSAAPSAASKDKVVSKRSFSRTGGSTDAASAAATMPNLVSLQETPVAAFFRRITSHASHKDLRVNEGAQSRRAKLSFRDDSGGSGSVEEGSSVPWQRGFVGYLKRIVAAAVVPTADPADGVWLSFVCEEDQTSWIELWQAAGNEFGSLECPIKKYSVSLGAAGILAVSWVPVPLPLPTNSLLGTCTFLRPTLMLTCQLPRRDLPSKTLHVSIAGATQVRVKDAGAPVDLRWHTAHTSLEQTYLFVMFSCNTVAVYQPVKEALNGKLTLLLTATVAPPPRYPPKSPVLDEAPPFLRCSPFAAGSVPGMGDVCLTVAHGESIAVMQGPSFQLINFHRIAPSAGSTPLGGGDGGPTAGGAASSLITALTCGAKGVTIASGNRISTYQYRMDHRELTSCCAAPVTAIEEVVPSLFSCGNAAGQLVQVKVRHSSVEINSLLWATMESQQQQSQQQQSGEPVGGVGGFAALLLPQTLMLRRNFDGSMPVPPESVTGASRFAFHPFASYTGGHQHQQQVVLTSFASGAWVLFRMPLTSE